jgi:tRNA G37 N-methylase TrmD
MKVSWDDYVLVGGDLTILKNMSSPMGRIIPYIMENKPNL